MDLINVYVGTNDTDVVVLLVAFIPDFLKINVDAQVIVICDAGTQKYCMSINVIAASITLERCKELLFSACIIMIRLYVKLFPRWKSKILELMVSQPGLTRDIHSFR